MTKKIKKILFVEEGWLSVFLKPTIQATKIGEKIDIEFTYKYNWLGCFTLNLVQLIFDFFYYGLSEFNPLKVMKEILDDRCIQVEENFEKYSRIFYVRYNNKSQIW